jgi:hypothetical protein
MAKPCRFLAAALLFAAMLPVQALAQTVQYVGPITNASGQSVQGPQPVDTTHPLPVTVTPTALSGATSTDASGTVTLGGTYQTVVAASSTRKGCLIQNPSTATEVLSIKVGTMAAPFTVAAGGSFSCAASGGLVVTDAITLTAATTAHAFSAVSQ